MSAAGCEHCDGGLMDCWSCDGDGDIREHDTYMRPRRCPECGGAGRVVCEESHQPLPPPVPFTCRHCGGRLAVGVLGVFSHVDYHRLNACRGGEDQRAGLFDSASIANYANFPECPDGYEADLSAPCVTVF